MDLYKLFGLSRTATAAEIERAYRRLARRYHPGVNPGDQVAETLYRQVQEAYGVLVDTERRRDYDRGQGRATQAPVRVETAVAFEGFDFSTQADGAMAATFSELFADVFQLAAREATSPGRGTDIGLRMTLSFSQAMRGGELPLSVTRQDRCVACHGDGHVSRAPASCPQCQGAGSRRWARGHMVFTKECESCGGEGRIAAELCRTCRGVGLSPRTEVVTVLVPAGIEHGARVAVPGHGHAGARGGAAGDLYITVEVTEHPHFTRIGRDIHVRFPLAVHEAALGVDVDVPTLDGVARLRVPPGTTSGQRFRLPGLGVGADTEPDAAGDLIVEIDLVLPAVLDERSKELLREFGRLNNVDVRQGLFDRSRP